VSVKRRSFRTRFSLSTKSNKIRKKSMPRGNDLLNKPNDAFMAYTTSFKLISVQAITPIGVYNYCQDLSKF
ncbi:9295_t:CDS:2, partial [Acaulospora colombiana]